MQLRILAVDDDQEALKLFKETVEPLGYEVVVLADGREAAQRISRDKFDLVALDAVMPRLGGWELVQHIRNSPSNQGIPILMFTPPDNDDAVRRGFALGITFYLEKPLRRENLHGLFSAARGLIVQQRRRYVRLPVRVPVTCRSGDKLFQTRSLDLAQGGILLESSGSLTVGETVQVEFSLPEIRKPLKVTGKVARKVSPDAMAIEFHEPEQLERAALQLFVSEKTTN